jgi:hypothetical protein
LICANPVVAVSIVTAGDNHQRFKSPDFEDDISCGPVILLGGKVVVPRKSDTVNKPSISLVSGHDARATVTCRPFVAGDDHRALGQEGSHGREEGEGRKGREIKPVAKRQRGDD